MIDGDFDFLPFRACLLYGDVPEYPIQGDFEHAVSVAFGARDAAADWRVEAVRWRRQHPGTPMDRKAIAIATAARLYDKIHLERG